MNRCAAQWIVGATLALSVGGCQACGSAQRASHDAQAIENQVTQAEQQAQQEQDTANQVDTTAQQAISGGQNQAKGALSALDTVASAIDTTGAQLLSGVLEAKRVIDVALFGVAVAGPGATAQKHELALQLDQCFSGLSVSRRQQAELDADTFDGTTWTRLTDQQKIDLAPHTTLFGCQASQVTGRGQ